MLELHTMTFGLLGEFLIFQPSQNNTPLVFLVTQFRAMLKRVAGRGKNRITMELEATTLKETV